MEPLTALAIATIAFTRATEKSIDKIPDTTQAKISQLRGVIWHRIYDYSEAEVSFTQAENLPDLSTIVTDLEELMLSDSVFAQTIIRLAREIEQAINIDQVEARSGINARINQDIAFGPNSPLIQELGGKAAFAVSWQEMEPITQQVGELLSLFTPDIFDWSWVESATDLLNWPSEDVAKAHQNLLEYNVIQLIEDREDYYQINPLVQEFLAEKLADSVQKDSLNHAFAEILVAIAKKIPESPTQDLIKSVQDAIPHLIKVAENLIPAVRDENLI